MDVISLALSKDYTEASLTGAGALKGDKGDPGPQGPTGPQGLQGEQGPVGPAGPQGEKGDTGAPGAQGLQGMPGEKGDTGDRGPAGISPTLTVNADNTEDVYKLDITDINGTFTTPNLVGRQGPQGLQGERGEAGPEGPQGLQGVQGVQGEKGNDGYPFLIYKEYTDISEFNADDFPEIGLMFMINDGVVGSDKPVYRYTGETDTPYSHVTDMATSEGLKGETGPQGPQGEQGVPGVAGVDGADGITFTPEIGLVQTVEAVQDADVQVEVDPDNHRAVYNFWLPRGPVGQQGLQGLTGLQGDPGEPGTTYTPSIGTIETVDSTLSASASVEIDADTKAAKFNFAIPRGEKGEDGLDAPQIDDAAVSEDSTWSSEQIEKRITNGVANVPTTPITSVDDTTNFGLGSANHFYAVRNGVCYFQIYLLVRNPVGTMTVVKEGFPKPLGNQIQYWAFPPYNEAADLTPLRFAVEPNGQVKAAFGTTNGLYMCHGSYPVA